ncbi:MAG: c-type cytochrome [Variibacter sp.]|nr:c-type cytochrome [Variibacter sp.]
MIRLLFGCVLALWAVGSMAQSPVERGGYLVNGILTCGNCHTPRLPDGRFDMERQLSGGPQTWDEPTFTVKGANITPDRETGIGAWSDADVKRALQHGLRPNGTPLAPLMPFNYYKVFLPADLDAVVAYVRSVKPVRHAVQPPVYKGSMSDAPYPGGDRAMTEEEMRDPVRRGFYLATIGHCMECHTPTVGGRHDYRDSLGKGGQTFEGPFGKSVARNITSHRTAGIGAWSDAQIKRAITHGVSRDGARLKPPMGYSLYATMTDGDLDALVAWLRTVPPRE